MTSEARARAADRLLAVERRVADAVEPAGQRLERARQLLPLHAHTREHVEQENGRAQVPRVRGVLGPQLEGRPRGGVPGEGAVVQLLALARLDRALDPVSHVRVDEDELALDALEQATRREPVRLSRERALEHRLHRLDPAAPAQDGGRVQDLAGALVEVLLELQRARRDAELGVKQARHRARQVARLGGRAEDDARDAELRQLREHGLAPPAEPMRAIHDDRRVALRRRDEQRLRDLLGHVREGRGGLALQPGQPGDREIPCVGLGQLAEQLAHRVPGHARPAGMARGLDEEPALGAARDPAAIEQLARALQQHDQAQGVVGPERVEIVEHGATARGHTREGGASGRGPRGPATAGRSAAAHGTDHAARVERGAAPAAARAARAAVERVGDGRARHRASTALAEARVGGQVHAARCALARAPRS